MGNFAENLNLGNRFRPPCISNWSSMTNDAITKGGIGVLRSLFYISIFKWICPAYSETLLARAYDT